MNESNTRPKERQLKMQNFKENLLLQTAFNIIDKSQDYDK